MTTASSLNVLSKRDAIELLELINRSVSCNDDKQLFDIFDRTKRFAAHSHASCSLFKCSPSAETAPTNCEPKVLGCLDYILRRFPMGGSCFSWKQVKEPELLWWDTALMI